MPDIFATEKPAGERTFTVSENATKRIAKLLEDEPSGAMLRVTVSGGGCSGFQYGFKFDDHTGSDDHLFQQGPVIVVVDDVSLDLLAGSQLDFVEDLIGAAFQVNNPNATSSCGCGASFSV